MSGRRTRRAALVAAAACAVVMAVSAGAPAVGKPPKPTPAPTATPKNVILFIGDGMAAEHVELGRRYLGSPLHIDGIPWGAVGSLNTDSLEGTTDSAAGATALATGFATNNGWLSMIPTDPPSPVETVLERAEDRGKASGLLTTVDLPDATAGAFAAHVTDRGEGTEVATQMHAQDIEVLMGGNGGGDTDPLLGHAGVAYVDDVAELNAYVAGPGIGPMYGLIGVGTPAYVIDREEEGVVGREPTLPQMTAGALDVLSADTDGFFLMVEGGAIDWGGHGRDPGMTATEMVAFDQAVKAGYDWAKNRSDTLILVTADHETGGLSVDAKTNMAAIRGQRASTEFMNGLIREGASITSVLSTYAGISNLTTAERNLIAANGEMGIADVLATRWKVRWGWSGTDEGEHTDTPVPIYAWGARAGDFAGTAYANERVGRLLLSYLP
jgi:alkaline phosphatase